MLLNDRTTSGERRRNIIYTDGAYRLLIACGCATPGPGTLEKVGTGTLILRATIPIRAARRILASVLQLGNGGTTGTILGNVLNDATFGINRSACFLRRLIAGNACSSRTNGGGITVFFDRNTYGGTVVNGGGRQLGRADSLGPNGTPAVNLGGDVRRSTATTSDGSRASPAPAT